VCRGCTDQQSLMNRTSMDIGDGASLELVDMFCYLGDMLSVDGDADVAVEATVCKGLNKFRHLMPLLTNKDVSFLIRGEIMHKLSCVRSCILHGSEMWRVKIENELTLQWAEMRMIRWMCGVKVTDRFLCSELRERLEMGDIITVIQRHRLRWYGHFLRRDENGWVKNAWIMK